MNSFHPEFIVEGYYIYLITFDIFIWGGIMFTSKGSSYNICAKKKEQKKKKRKKQ